MCVSTADFCACQKLSHRSPVPVLTTWSLGKCLGLVGLKLLLPRRIFSHPPGNESFLFILRRWHNTLDVIITLDARSDDWKDLLVLRRSM